MVDLLEPQWRDLQQGDRIDIVANLIVKNGPEGHLFQASVSGTRLIVQGEVPQGSFLYTMLQIEVQEVQPVVKTSIVECSKVWTHEPWTQESAHTAVETCQGMGGFTQGFQSAGVKVTIGNDVQKSYTQWMTARGHRVVTGSIGCAETIGEIHAAQPSPGWFSAGVPCQPWSKLGDQKGLADQRGTTLCQVLRAAWFLQPLVVILECVPEAGKDPEVQKVLAKWGQAVGMRRSEVVMHLQRAWPAKRTRWYCVAMHHAIPDIHLQDLPQMPAMPKVGDLLPEFAVWPSEQSKALELGTYEKQCYEECGGIQMQLVDKTQPLKTILHCMGTQLGPCPCGCRSGPLAYDRLKSRGLFGALVQMPSQQAKGLQQARVRHAHPWELAVLNGMQPEQYEGSLPLAMTGLGQMASPLQVTWLVAQVQEHLQNHKVVAYPEKQDPKTALWRHMQKLFKTRDQKLPLFAHHPVTTAFKAMCQQVLTGASQKDPEEHDESRGDNQESQKAYGPYGAGGAILAFANHGMQAQIGKEDQAKTPPQARPSGAGLRSPRGDWIDQPRPTLPTGAQEAGAQQTAEKDTDQRRTTLSPTQPEDTEDDKTEDNGLIAPANESQRQDNKAPKRHLVFEDLVAKKKQRQTEEDRELEDPVRQSEVTTLEIVRSGKSYTTRVEGPTTIGQLARAERDLEQDQTIVVTDAMGQRATDETHLAQGSRWYVHPARDLQIVDAQSHPVHKQGDKPRINLLHQQQAWVAADEMHYYLEEIAHKGMAHANKPIVGSQVQVATKLRHQCLTAPYKPVVTAVLTQGHWHPVHIAPSRQGTSVEVHTTEEIGSQMLAEYNTTGPGKTPTIRWTNPPKAFPNDCGFQAIATLESILQGGETPTACTAADAASMRRRFETYVHQNMAPNRPSPQLYIGGAQVDPLTIELKALLEKHGVPADKQDQRAESIIERLGRGPVQAALRAKRPWMDLKAKANACLPKLQLVHPSELEAVVQSRKETRVGHKGQKTREKPMPVELKPHDVEIPPGVFKQLPDKPLSQLAFEMLGRDQVGVVVATAQQAVHYIGQRPISQGGLALLVLDHQHPQIVGKGPQVKFPAKCASTDEPVILSAVLIQLGQAQVGREQPQETITLEQVDHMVLRVLAFADEYAENWNSLLQSPVRKLVEITPPLQAALQDREHILEVFDRQYLTSQMKKASREEAKIFIATFRVKGQITQATFDEPATAGIYVEPRSADGRSPHTGFAVVWFQGKSREELVALKQTNEQWSSVARMGDKYGLRVETQHARAMHQHHKPQVPFLDGGKPKAYTVGPWPHGTTRTALNKVLEQWQWQARAISPIHRTPDGQGSMWRVHANSDPPSSVYTMSHGDIIIASIDQGKPAPQDRTAEIVCTRKTLDALKHTEDPPSKREDPWLTQDPWSHAMPPKTARVSPSATDLQKIQSAVEKNVIAALRPTEDVTMTEAAKSSRIGCNSWRQA